MKSTMTATSKRVQTPRAILFSDFDITVLIPVHCAECSRQKGYSDHRSGVTSRGFATVPGRGAAVMSSTSVVSALGQKQTCTAHKAMSANCQKRTFMFVQFARSKFQYEQIGI